ncbi:MAG: hypothetical protein CL916_00295 [Deltaproteobacteria bacterium]|nr:hypothetical protein [Deltaproteobacteria bacterium]
MPFDMRFFRVPEDVIHYISSYEIHEEDSFACLSIVVPTLAVKRTMMRKVSSLRIQWFSIREYVCDIVYRANRIPHTESPIFTLLIREVMNHFVHQGNELIKELEQTLYPFERGYEGLYEAVRVLISSGLREEDVSILDSILEEPEIHLIDKKRAQAVILIASVMRKLVQEGLASIRSNNEQDGNLGIQDASLAQAANLIRDGYASLPSENVLFYGFPDFTGMQIQLFDAVVSKAQHVELLLYEVRDFAIVGRSVLDAAHDIVSSTLQEKTLHTATVYSAKHNDRVPEILFTSALGYQAELRDVFVHVCDLLQQGVAPEDILLVAPSWENYKPFLRYEAQRVQLPVAMTKKLHFPTQKTRKMESFIQMLLNGELFSLSTVFSLFSFDVIEREYTRCIQENPKIHARQSLLDDSDIIDYERVLLEDIQLYFQAFGLRDLEDLDEKELLLEEVWNQKDSAGNPKIYTSIPALLQMKQAYKKGVPVYQASRRKIPIQLLKYMQAQCLALLSLIKNLHKSIEDHSYRAVLEKICLVLGWSKRSEEWRAIHCALTRIEQIIYKGYSLTYQDFLSVFTVEIGPFGTEVFGSNTHDEPVILLTTLEESSGIFSEHIFMLGLNKGEVPGQFPSDPLLTEDIRGRLQTVLPALRTRKSSYLNERHRLYSLFSACSSAHLSWVLTDELGQASTVSPLIRRLLLAFPNDKVKMARSLYARARQDEVLPLYDRILLSGIHGEQDTYANALSLYAQRFWVDLYPELSDHQKKERIEKVIMGRMEGILELYPPPYSSVHKRIGPLGGMTGLGPLSGAIPEDPFAPVDPIPDTLHIDHSNFITRVEQYFSCPWRNFLERLLRAEHTEDPQKTLPQLRANTLGNIVHNALEQFVYVQSPLGKQPESQNLEDFFPPEPFEVIWNEQKIQSQLVEQSKNQMFHDQQLWPKSNDVAFKMSLPYMEIEKSLEFQEGISCLGAELEGDSYVYAHAEGGSVCPERMDCFSLSQGSEDPIAIRVLFKADRVDMDCESNVLSLLDYKTGRIPKSKEGEKEKRLALLKEMKHGKKLQPAAYVASYKALQQKWPELQGTTGKLLYLKPDISTDLSLRGFSITHDDEEAISVFARTLWAASLGQVLGVNFPRLTRRKNRAPHSTNDWCKHCNFQRACRFHDSGYRKRILESCSKEQPESIGTQKTSVDVSIRLRTWRDFVMKKVWNIGEVQ